MGQSVGESKTRRGMCTLKIRQIACALVGSAAASMPMNPSTFCVGMSGLARPLESSMCAAASYCRYSVTVSRSAKIEGESVSEAQNRGFRRKIAHTFRTRRGYSNDLMTRGLEVLACCNGGRRMRGVGHASLRNASLGIRRRAPIRDAGMSLHPRRASERSLAHC
jgi:hypothetical protein